jgi:hypothetical protein
MPTSWDREYFASKTLVAHVLPLQTYFYETRVSLKTDLKGWSQFKMHCPSDEPSIRPTTIGLGERARGGGWSDGTRF